MTDKTEQDKQTKLYDMVNKVKLAMLTTIEPDGSLHTRPMQNQEADKRGNIWFFTDKNCSAARNARDNPKVSVSYSNPDSDNYVAIAGTASLIDDRDTIHEKWTEDMKAWFPDGEDDPNILLLKIEPERGEYWDTASSTLATAVGYVKATLTGKRPDELTDKAKMRL